MFQQFGLHENYQCHTWFVLFMWTITFRTSRDSMITTTHIIFFRSKISAHPGMLEQSLSSKQNVVWNFNFINNFWWKGQNDWVREQAACVSRRAKAVWVSPKIQSMFLTAAFTAFLVLWSFKMKKTFLIIIFGLGLFSKIIPISFPKRF